MLDYTESEYRGYIIEYATSPANEPGKWMGHFRVRRDGFPTFASSIANLQPTQTDAQNIAVRFARERVNNEPIRDGDVGSFQPLTSGDYIDCEVVVAGTWRDAQVSITALKMLTGTDDRLKGIELAKGLIGTPLVAAARRFPGTSKIALDPDDINAGPVLYRG